MPWQPVKYCVSLLPHTEEELYITLPAALDADLIEIRLDYLGHIDLHRLRSSISRKLIITVRPPEEGGFWKGTIGEKVAIFRDAMVAGADYLDIEWRGFEQIRSMLEFQGKTELILSYHTGSNHPEQLQHRLQEMMTVPAAVYKLVYTARHLDDCLAVFSLTQMVRQNKRQYVIHAMGETGQLSRILGALQGNQFTYVSLGAATATAEGQIDLYTAREVYFLHEKTPATRVIGLLGYPVVQSFGWKLHNRLRHAQRSQEPLTGTDTSDFIYVNFPAENFDEFWDNWSDQVDGLSITIPHKQSIVSRLDYVSQTVEETGVCNTAVRKNGKWWGFNTDYMAIFQLLNEILWGGKDTFLIYGTGATARSAVAAAKVVAAAPIYITGRNAGEGEKIAHTFGISFIPLERVAEVCPRAIIQTTPIGMYPDIDEMPPLLHLLPQAGLVFDVVYNPAVTAFLLAAVDNQCKIISGENMYLLQASKQFALFSGQVPDALGLKRTWDDIVSA